MCQEIVKIPTIFSKFVSNKSEKKAGDYLPAVHCIYVIKFQLESLLSTYHRFSYFDFH